jgi:hypothetical protein
MVTGGAGPSYMAAESHLAAVSYCPVAAIAVRLPRTRAGGVPGLKTADLFPGLPRDKMAFPTVAFLEIRSDKIVGLHDASTLHDSRRYAIPRCLGPSLTPRHKGTVNWR